MEEVNSSLTILNIIDTSVKIGLGAIITGIGAYFVTKLNHNNEIEKQSVRRRKELLEDIAKSVEEFWNNFRRYYLLSMEIIHNTKNNENINNDLLVEYDKRKHNVIESTSKLSEAQSLLLLLGEIDAKSILERMANKSDIYVRATDDIDTDETITDINEKFDVVHTMREAFYAELHDKYNKKTF